MSTYIGITGSSPPSSGSISLNLENATKRVANLLRRNNINSEIMLWLDFSLKELCEEVDFPELRVIGDPITCVPEQYEYSLPSDYARMASVYYLCTSAVPTWGRNLESLPLSFYKGDSVDFERLLNRGIPSRGDPKFYFIEKQKLVIYPAFRTDEGASGTLTPTYYKIPVDWTETTQFPEIHHRWQHYLIWLAYFWGMAFEEKDDVVKPEYWEKKAQRVITFIKRKVSRRDNKRLIYLLPESGLEGADAHY